MSHPIDPAQVVVVGAGPAGCSAAVQCVRLGVRPRLLDKTGRPGGLVRNAFRVENYLGLEPMDGKAFVARMSNHLRRFGVEVERSHVRRVGLSGGPGDERFFVVTTREGVIHARSVILASGTQPRRLPVLQDLEAPVSGAVVGEECGVPLVYHEVADLRACAGGPGHVAVVGGGEAALDFSLTLARSGARVTVLVRSAELKACGRLVEQVGAAEAVAVRMRARVVGCRRYSAPGADGKIALDVDVAGEIQPLMCHAVLVAIGRRSALEQILDSDLLRRLVGRGLYPEVPGLFVAGDARTGALGQVSMAAGDGIEAAMAAVRHVRGEHDHETALHDR